VSLTVLNCNFAQLHLVRSVIHSIDGWNASFKSMSST
jgi:hypothetical protein